MGSSVSIRSGRLAVVAASVLTALTGSGAFAQDNSAKTGNNDSLSPSFELETGVNWLNLPSWDARDTDVFTGSAGSRVTDIGLGIGYTLNLPIGEIGEQPLVLEWSGGIAGLSTDSSSRTSLAGGSSFDLTLGNTGYGSITLGFPAPAATTAVVTVTDSAGGTAGISASAASAGTGQITQFASNSAITGGVFTALVTNGATGSATAVGAYGDNTGFTLRAEGDLSGSALVSSRSEDVTAFDQTLLLGAPIALSDGWTITPKIGPTYRSIDRDVDFTQTLDIGASIPGVDVPDVGVAQNDELDARYIGAIAGLSLSKQIQPDLALTLDATLGAAHLHSRYRSQYSAIIPGVSVAGFDSISETRNDAAILAGLNAGIRYDASENVAVGFTTGIDFTSKVPTIKYVADGAGGTTPTVDTSHAINFSAKANITWRF
ncbi:hypothetical protein QTL95_07815 [Rhizobium sp. S152]|uniref:hypothetical protein n=1 Tax=Rhizobium sp. S152 TaxID=3055038 RepID=UPI0025A99001|nr:hypothetical protein [Rhizobium sp. S152]MDM9625798.1 hypothetical protein [Rhizobium sp. S152]